MADLGRDHQNSTPISIVVKFTVPIPRKVNTVGQIHHFHEIMLKFRHHFRVSFVIILSSWSKFGEKILKKCKNMCPLSRNSRILLKLLFTKEKVGTSFEYDYFNIVVIFPSHLNKISMFAKKNNPTIVLVCPLFSEMLNIA